MGKNRNPGHVRALNRGLLLHEDGEYRYRFMFKGKLFTGNTHLREEKDAREWVKDLRDHVRLLMRGRISMPPEPNPELASAPKKMTLGALIDLWELTKTPICAKSHVQPTVNSLRTHFAELLKFPVMEMTVTEVNAAVGTYLSTKGWNCGRGGAPAPRNHTARGARALLKRLRDVMSFGLKMKVLTDLPFELEYPKPEEVQRHTLTFDLMAKFLGIVDRARNPHLGMAVRLMLWLGLREEEALNMSWEGVRWDQNQCFPDVTKMSDGQGAAMPLDLKEFLESHPDRKASGLMLPSRLRSDGKGADPYRPGFTSGIIEFGFCKVVWDGLADLDKRRLLAKIDLHPDSNLRLLVRMMLLLGLTESGARAIRWKKVNMEDKVIHTESPGGEVTLEPIPGWLYEVLDKVPVEQRKGRIVSAAMGRHKGNGLFKYGEATRLLVMEWKGLNLPRLTPHRLRASFATIHALEIKTEIAVVSKMMRHADISTTMRYVNVNRKAVQDAQNNWPSIHE